MNYYVLIKMSDGHYLLHASVYVLEDAKLSASDARKLYKSIKASDVLVVTQVHDA